MLMFLLQDIPTLNTLMLLKNRYSSLNPSAMRSCLMLLRTGSDLLVLADKLFRKVGLSQGGFLTLLVLNRDPKAELTPSELSEKIGVTRATMTGLLDTLARDGQIQRLQHKEDRRKLVVRLTDKEQQVLIKLLEKVSRGLKAKSIRKTSLRL
jgi:MarR family transcriptional repressor of emrRAB